MTPARAETAAATATAAAAAAAALDAVAWHDVECGGYGADLELWLALAQATGDPVLDIGAGTGRVALTLARAGHGVVALDRDPALLAALTERARRLPVSTVCADARVFSLEAKFALCLVPMQTIQLLGGVTGRAQFLACARAHLRRGGLLAAALLPETFEQFDAADGDAPDPEQLIRGDATYSSQPSALRIEPDAIVIERVRTRTPPGAPTGETHDVVRLDRVTAADIADQARDAGFEPEPARAVAATSEHIGSDVVMLRA